MAKFPDAVRIPGNWAAGNSSVDRQISIVDAVEPMLGVDRSVGERGWCGSLPNGEFFCTKRTDSTLFFPKMHRLEGHPRYNWVAQADGTVFGYLVKEAMPVAAPSEVANA